VEGLLDEYFSGDLATAWPDTPCDAIVHLAALSAVGPSFADPQGFICANSAPLTNLCEGLLGRSARSRVIMVSTGAVYAPGSDLTESAETEPTSPYAVSKLLTELQATYYRRRGLDIVTMRPFNHIGPGQGPGFLLPDLANGVEEAARAREPLRVGNLDTRRDYTDVRDVVRAYRLAVEAPDVSAPLLNVCSGQSISGREILSHLVEALGLEMPPLQVDTARLRPEDPGTISGDNTLIQKTLGWVPEIDLATTVRDFVAGRSA
jgi:GDP-4-dehydro-6-deoxy-D-mannose reductase